MANIDDFDGVPATSNEAEGKCFSSVTSYLLPRQCLPDIYENRCSKISCCSTVAWIRSFQVYKLGSPNLNEYTNVSIIPVEFQFNHWSRFHEALRLTKAGLSD